MTNHEPHVVLQYPHKADIYTYRIPTPPRIVVPPPALNADAIPDITLSALRSSSYDFLHNVNYSNLVQSNAPLDWNYEKRREAQNILPFLALGPMTAAKDEGYLRLNNVTMLLGVRHKHSFESKLMNGALRTAEKLGLECRTVDLAGYQDLIRSLPHTTAIINEHLAQVHQRTGKLGKVLVFCESGNERSAGVVAAYLMETHESVDYIKAMQLCQAQRFCVNFDDGLKRLLQGYWDILMARRAVAEQQRPQANVVNGANGIDGPVNGTPDAPVAASTARRKRTLERERPEDQDQDVDMDGVDQDDFERFGGRSFAPFRDQPM